MEAEAPRTEQQERLEQKLVSFRHSAEDDEEEEERLERRLQELRSLRGASHGLTKRNSANGGQGDTLS